MSLALFPGSPRVCDKLFRVLSHFSTLQVMEPGNEASPSHFLSPLLLTLSLMSSVAFNCQKSLRNVYEA